MNNQNPYYSEQNLNSQQTPHPIKMSQNQKVYAVQGVKPNIQNSVQNYPPLQSQYQPQPQPQPQSQPQVIVQPQYVLAQPQMIGNLVIPNQKTPCPFCHQYAQILSTKKTGPTIWLWCLGLAIFTGCCCIPFCIDDCYDQVFTCSNCNATRQVIKSRFGC